MPGSRVQIGDDTLQNHCWCLLRILHVLATVHVGTRSNRHISEGTQQIEIAERTQCQHLALVGGQLRLGIARVYFKHIWSLFQYQVATVNNLIKLSPVGIYVVARHVTQADFTDGCFLGICTLGKMGNLIRTHISPNYTALYDGFASHGLISSGYHALHIASALPELIADGTVHRKYRCVKAGREGSRHEASQKYTDKNILLHISIITVHTFWYYTSYFLVLQFYFTVYP